MTEQTKDTIVGIDLGTTNSVVAAIVEGKATVLKEGSESVLPSVVAITPEGKLVTGTVARNQLAAFPGRTIASVKRRMGTMNPIVLGDQSFTPPEISAMILRRLRERASQALGTNVTRAVITVPAFFDEHQRQATREAGELAGLKVERIINEPTAATLVYHAGSTDRKQIVVYDFGGGTFDVSVVQMESGVVEVLSSKGDTQLGGDDLDAALLDFVADAFLDEHRIDLRETPSTRYRLLLACEAAKVRLSTDESTLISEAFIAEKDGQPLNLSQEVTRAEFEELIAPLIDRTINSVDEAIRDASMTIEQIDDLVLVGGSTRTPLVHQRLRDEFKLEPSRAVDPDLAVAMGAAVQASSIAGNSVGPVLVDVTGHTLGIEALDATSAGQNLVFSPIIHRNSPLPARHEQAYFTMHEEQKVAEIHVLQGESSDISKNLSVGKLKLNLNTDNDGDRKVVVRFDLTLDGTLNVTATQAATGASEVLVVNNALSQFQADHRAEAVERLSNLFEASDEIDSSPSPQSKQWRIDNASAIISPSKSPAAADDLESEFPAASKALRDADAIIASLEGEDKEDVEELSAELRQAVENKDPQQVDQITNELEDVLYYVKDQ